jgi:hypothetical protein
MNIFKEATEVAIMAMLADWGMVGGGNPTTTKKRGHLTFFFFW